MSATVLCVRGAAKAFAGAVALRGAELAVEQGEIHALLGENGAGKSTLIKLLAGVHAPDGGRFEVAGTELPQGFSPADVAKAGIRFVHQDFGLIDTMTIMENMALVGGFERRYGMIDYVASERRTAAKLDQLGLRLNPRDMAGSLPVAEKAILALARAMEDDARLIVLDEVTASLPSPDVGRVHEAIRAARAKGVSFIYVSHRLDEVLQLCDRLTVLRDGATVATADVRDTSMQQIVEWIAGRPLSTERGVHFVSGGKIRLQVTGLLGRDIAEPLDLRVAAGEIVGVTGIIGSGYDQICEMVAGIVPVRAGTVRVDDASVTTGNAAASRRAGIETILGDRSRAAFAERNVRENLFADGLFRTRGRPDLAGEWARARDLVRIYGIRPQDCTESAIQTLSGGNQQKALFARALMTEPKVLVLVDPTAGVDVGARAELHMLLEATVRKGTAVLFGSSDFEEIAAVADRVLMIRDSRVSAEITGEDVTWDRLFMEAHAGRQVIMHGPAAEVTS